MRCWRSSEIACPSHRRSIHSETSQLRYMLGSRPQVTHVHAPFFHFFCVIYDSVFHTTILQNFIFPQWKLDGCRIEERTQFCERNIKKTDAPCHSFSFYTRFGDDHRVSNIGNKVFNSTRNKIGQFKTRACAGKLLFLPRTLAPVSSG